MPSARERSCSEKEVQAIRFNHNEQRCLEKKISGLKQEGACSIQLINQTHKNIKVSYKNLKDKVSKIKTNLTVKEIDTFRKLEEEGKIQVFKSIAKPDSSNRISAYAKRLNINYENNPGAAAKHSDDLVVINSFCDDQLTRKDILLRQISDLNERFNATVQRERELERRNLPKRDISSFIKEINNRNKSDSDYETDHSNYEIENRSDLCHLDIDTCPRKDFIARPSTAFEFSEKYSFNDVSRPATSLGSFKTDKKMSKSSYKPKRSKSVKTMHTVRETECTREFKQVKNYQNVNTKPTVRRAKSLKNESKLTLTTASNDKKKSKTAETEVQHEPTFKTDIETDAPKQTDILSEHNNDNHSNKADIKSTSKVTKQSNTMTDKCSSPKNLKHSQSLKEQGTKTSIKERRAKSSVLKHSQSIKEEPDTGTINSSSSNLKRRQTVKVRPSTSVSTTQPNTVGRSIEKKPLSASSVKRSEAWINLMASMNGPQRAPFDCHAAAEKEEKEMASATSKNKQEGGRTKFLSSDSIEGNLGQDLHEELRKELLQEEGMKAMYIEDKICNFMDRLDDKIKSERSEPWAEKQHMLTIDEIMTGNIEVPKQKRVNVRRQNSRLYNQQQRKMGNQIDQLNLMNGLKYGDFEATV